MVFFNKVLLDFSSDGIVLSILDQGAETGQKLYKLCLRMWQVFPTEIICPGTGLVFGGNTEDHIQPKLIEMKWTRSFNEALSKVIVHSAWRNEFYLMVSAESPGEIIWSHLILEKFDYAETIARA